MRVARQTQPYLPNSQLLFTFWNQILAAVSMVTVTSSYPPLPPPIPPDETAASMRGRCQGKSIGTRHLSTLWLFNGVQRSPEPRLTNSLVKKKYEYETVSPCLRRGRGEWGLDNKKVFRPLIILLFNNNYWYLENKCDSTAIKDCLWITYTEWTNYR